MKKIYYNLKKLYKKKYELNHIKGGVTISLEIYLINLFLFFIILLYFLLF